MTNLISYLILAVVLANFVVTLLKKGSIPLDSQALKHEISQEVTAQVSAIIAATKSDIISAIGASRVETIATQQTIMASGIDSLTNTQAQAINMQDKRLQELTQNLEQNQLQLVKFIDEKLFVFEQKQSERIQTLSKTVTDMTAAQDLAQTKQFGLQDKRLQEISQTLTHNQAQLAEFMNEKLLGFEQKQSTRMLALEKTVSTMTASQAEAQAKQFALQDKRLLEIAQLLTQAQGELQNAVAKQLQTVSEQFAAFNAQSKASMEEMRKVMQGSLDSMRVDNSTQLEKMRVTVDEKLQKTLDSRISQSFQMVNDRLQEVYQGLGEMKTLATGVGDLKKVLTNVKTRGIIGEYQLGAIMEEILSPEQYVENVVTKPGATTRVEFAIKLPGEGDNHVFLPIDAKFPADTYMQLVDAYEIGNADQIAVAKLALANRIRGEAKDIHDKYIEPPYTTDFAIMFLPFEGLYAEVVRDGLIDELQRKYKVNIAGPTTFAALLNSLQMGFKTLAIQKRSSEVWNVLSAVKTEFANFETVLEAAKKRIDQTNTELDKLIGVRTRKINTKLRAVSTLPEPESAAILDTVTELLE